MMKNKQNNEKEKEKFDRELDDLIKQIDMILNESYLDEIQNINKQIEKLRNDKLNINRKIGELQKRKSSIKIKYEQERQSKLNK